MVPAVTDTLRPQPEQAQRPSAVRQPFSLHTLDNEPRLAIAIAPDKRRRPAHRCLGIVLPEQPLSDHMLRPDGVLPEIVLPDMLLFELFVQ